MTDKKEEELNQQLIPRLKVLEEYDQIVPIANGLQEQINDMTESLKTDPLDESLAERINGLKKEVAEKSKRFNQLKNETIKAI